MTYNTHTTTTTTNTIGGHDNSDKENLTNAIIITVSSLAALCALACIKWRRDVRRQKNSLQRRNYEAPSPASPIEIDGYVQINNPAPYMENRTEENYFYEQSSPESSIDPSPSPINEENYNTFQGNSAKTGSPIYDTLGDLAKRQSEHFYEYDNLKNTQDRTPGGKDGVAAQSPDRNSIDTSNATDSGPSSRRHTTGNMLGNESGQPSTQTSNTNTEALSFQWGRRVSMV